MPTSVSDLILAARSGEPGALDTLMGHYRNYLRLLARASIDTSVRVRADPSDAAQEALLKACQGFGDFRGTSEAELAAWLRRIMTNYLTDLERRHHAEGRDVGRERSLEEVLEHSSFALSRLVPVAEDSPSWRARRREMSVVVADALAALDPDDREVLILRSLHELGWAEVGRRMKRSGDAARVLWARALRRLGAVLEERWPSL
jgi:RNA polymerase sigma-70 factor (ECF subfamily)